MQYEGLSFWQEGLPTGSAATDSGPILVQQETTRCMHVMRRCDRQVLTMNLALNSSSLIFAARAAPFSTARILPVWSLRSGSEYTQRSSNILWPLPNDCAATMRPPVLP